MQMIDAHCFTVSPVLYPVHPFIPVNQMIAPVPLRLLMRLGK
jgi:hypothetical protein